MTPDSSSREAILISIFLWTASMAAAAAWLWRPIQHSNDLFWHLAAGRYIWTHHAIPRTDVFSFTCAGHRWINHEWLLQVLLFGAYRLAQYRALNVLKLAFILGAFWVTAGRQWLTASSTMIRWLALALVFWASRYAWFLRADLASIFFFSFLLALLSLYEKSENAAALAPCPVLFAVWSNMHGGFTLGLAAMAAFVVGAVADKKDRRYLMIFAGTGILCVAATLLNPNGVSLYRSTWNGLQLLRSGLISEWQRTPWHPLELFWACLALYWALVLYATARQARPRWADLCVALLLSWSAARYVRNVPYFMLGAFAALPDFFPKARLPLKWERAIGAAATLVVVIGGIRSLSQASSGVDPAFYPVEACEFVAGTDPSIRYFNDYRFGGYWLWRFGTQRPDFFDGRYHTVEGFPELYERTRRAQHGPPAGWQTILAGYHIGAALLAEPVGTDEAVFRVYFPRRDWALVYRDGVALVFLRRSPKTRDIIRKREL